MCQLLTGHLHVNRRGLNVEENNWPKCVVITFKPATKNSFGAFSCHQSLDRWLETGCERGWRDMQQKATGWIWPQVFSEVVLSSKAAAHLLTW